MTTIKTGTNVFDPPSGMLRAGAVVESSGNNFRVQLGEVPAVRGTAPSVPVPRVFPLLDSSGLFIGSLPSKDTTVMVGQSLGGKYHIVNFEPEKTAFVPQLKQGQLLIRSTDTSKILLDIESNIKIGSNTNNIHVFASSQRYSKSNLITINFENENHFTQAYREIGGLVKRDLDPKRKAASYNGSSKLEDDSYDPLYVLIGLDPTSTANDIKTGPSNPDIV